MSFLFTLSSNVCRLVLLAKLLLDEVDKTLKTRGYRFARFADESNVYVGRKNAGERAMAYLRIYTWA